MLGAQMSDISMSYDIGNDGNIYTLLLLLLLFIKAYSSHRDVFPYTGRTTRVSIGGVWVQTVSMYIQIIPILQCSIFPYIIGFDYNEHNRQIVGILRAGNS